MKYDTVVDIRKLRQIIAAKIDRVGAIKRRIEHIENLIPVMSETNKREAMKELLELKIELKEHDKFLGKAEQQIREFYRPAVA